MPALAVSAIFSFIFSWNELLYALILTRSEAKTAPVVATSFMSGYELPWGQIHGDRDAGGPASDRFQHDRLTPVGSRSHSGRCQVAAVLADPDAGSFASFGNLLPRLLKQLYRTLVRPEQVNPVCWKMECNALSTFCTV